MPEQIYATGQWTLTDEEYNQFTEMQNQFDTNLDVFEKSFTEKEHEFIEQMIERYAKYDANMYCSQRQWDWLCQLFIKFSENLDG